MSFAPFGVGPSPEVFFPQTNSDTTFPCPPEEDFFFYLRPMPAYMGALSILVGIGAGPQIPQSYESDPWQAPVIQQTDNRVVVPVDQGDWAHGVFDDDGYVPRIIWPDANTLRVVWDDGGLPVAPIAAPPDDGYCPPPILQAPWVGRLSVLVGCSNPSVVPAGPPVVDEQYALSTMLPWPEITTIIGPWGYANSEDVAFEPVPAEEVFWLPRIVWPSWTPTPVVYDDAYIAFPPPPVVDEFYFIPRIVWSSWTPTRVVYDDAEIAQTAVPLLVEWQEWQRPIIWPSGPPLRVLQPWLNEPSNWFLPFALHADLRVTDLGDDRYIVTDAGGNRYLVRDIGLFRLGVVDV